LKPGATSGDDRREWERPRVKKSEVMQGTHQAPVRPGRSAGGHTVRRLSWIRPDRGPAPRRRPEDQDVIGHYREAAAGLGVEVMLNTSEQVSIDASDPARPRTFLCGEPVTAHDTIFVTALRTPPHDGPGVLDQLLLSAHLQELGFYLPIPPHLSHLGWDASATALHLAACPIGPLPAVCAPVDREAPSRPADAALDGPRHPVPIQPAARGPRPKASGTHHVHDTVAGGDAPAAWPHLAGVRTVRAYLVDGRAHTAHTGCADHAGRHAGPATAGHGFGALPAELADAAVHIAARIPVPYLTVDFLHDGDRWWVAGIDFDGAAGFSGVPVQDAAARQVVAARLGAYLAGHAAAWTVRATRAARAARNAPGCA
jgi:hypothetical protein